MSDTDISNPSAPPAANGNRRRILVIIAVIFLVLGAAWLLLDRLVLSQRESTDDAYVAGNQVRISSQLGGTVVEVLAGNTSRVEAGQVLVKLDPTDAQQALDRASAALAQAVRQVRANVQSADQFDALIKVRRLELTRAEADLSLREPLLAERAVADEEVRHAREAVALAQAQLSQAQRQAAASRALVDATTVADNPAVLAQRAAYRDAWIAVHRTAIVAPVAGYVAQRSVQLGQRIAPGEPLMTVIPLQDVWLDANFKESQLRNLRIGQPVRITSDQYGRSVVYHGQVVGLQAGTGAAFSLLPPQNASGNWIKVVQRVPVKIALDRDEVAANPLRIGLSMDAVVDTHERGGPVLAAEPASDVQEITAAYAADLAAADAAATEIVQRNSGGA
ncbi:MAG: HlyD family efflux transporter periplasmic adaptor subunit [Steroidobacteraceae bacterium]